MRRREFEMDRERALELLARAPVVRLATTSPDGDPILRTLNAAVADGWILFHGAKAGEKALALARQAVIAADEVIATVPSYFVDAERACPATTFYESVQVHGRIERIDEPELKAKALTALMHKYQPEGGYVPIAADHPLYDGQVRGVLVFGVALEHVTGKLKVGQNRKPHEITAIVEGLWQRGREGDARAVQCVLDANAEVARPERFRAGPDVVLQPALDERSLAAALDLVAEEYWNLGYDRTKLGLAHLGASAWVGARHSDGTLIGTARALSDGAKHAFIADVAVHRAFRGRGIGRALVRLLLDHPQLRRADLIRLGTRDAQSFYAQLGFIESSAIDFGFPVTTMMLRRQGGARA